MKDKILTFVIGFLVGAIVATAGFYIYSQLNKNQSTLQNGIPQNMEQSMPNGNFQNMKFDKKGIKKNNEQNTPPELPSDNENMQPQNNPPEMPNNSNTQTNSNNA